MDRGVNLVLDDAVRLQKIQFMFVVCIWALINIDIVASQFGNARPELYQKSNRSSHSSDTSSAYSGSDTMTSVHSSVDADEVDLSGLVESIVDSDEEEDLAESMDVSP